MASEKRLISLDDVLQKLLIDAAESRGIIRSLILDVVDYLKKQPVIDAVEVVRCKDCKHWHEETGWCYHHSHFIDTKGDACPPWESSDWKMFDAEYFCADGERKDNADL